MFKLQQSFFPDFFQTAYFLGKFRKRTRGRVFFAFIFDTIFSRKTRILQRTKILKPKSKEGTYQKIYLLITYRKPHVHIFCEIEGNLGIQKVIWQEKHINHLIQQHPQLHVVVLLCICCITSLHARKRYIVKIYVFLSFYFCQWMHYVLCLCELI